MDSREEGYDPYNSARRVDNRFALKIRENVRYGQFTIRNNLESRFATVPIITVHSPFSLLMDHETAIALAALVMQIRATHENLTKSSPRA